MVDTSWYPTLLQIFYLLVPRWSYAGGTNASFWADRLAGRATGPVGLGNHGWGTTVRRCGEERRGQGCSEHGKHLLVFVFFIILYTFFCFFYFLFWHQLKPATFLCFITLAIMLISHKNDMIKPDFILFASKRQRILLCFWLDETSWIPYFSLWF